MEDHFGSERDQSPLGRFKDFGKESEQDSSQSIEQVESQLWNTLERALSVIDTLASAEGQQESAAVKSAKQRLEKQLTGNLGTVRKVHGLLAERGADQSELTRLEG